MPAVEHDIFVDSSCLSCVIAAMQGVAAPTGDLAAQEVALVRTYLYAPGTLWTVPTVDREFERLTEPAQRAGHRAWVSVLFGLRPPQDYGAVRRRTDELGKAHGDPDDCLVVAEVEGAGGDVLLTLDGGMVRHLAPHTRLFLTTPALYWEALTIPRGARPRQVPAPANPLRREEWWRW
jgi:hypothetical protein